MVFLKQRLFQIGDGSNDREKPGFADRKARLPLIFPKKRQASDRIQEDQQAEVHDARGAEGKDGENRGGQRTKNK